MDWQDPLIVTDRHGRPTDALRGMLAGRGALLVCGGPSLATLPLERIRERGIYSLGVNNAAAAARTSAQVAGDLPRRFHHAVYDDPTVDKFVPLDRITDPNKGLLHRQDQEGKFHEWKHVRDCPRVWGFEWRKWLRTDTDMWFTESGASFGNSSACAKKIGQPKTCNTMLLGLRLLQYMGATRIYLLGVDFNFDATRIDPEDGKQTVGNYAWPQAKPVKDVPKCQFKLDVSALWLAELRPLFERYGFQTFNCNPDSNLKAFDYVPFEEALDDCRGACPAGELQLAGWYENNRK